MLSLFNSRVFLPFLALLVLVLPTSFAFYYDTERCRECFAQEGCKYCWDGSGAAQLTNETLLDFDYTCKCGDDIVDTDSCWDESTTCDWYDDWADNFQDAVRTVAVALLVVVVVIVVGIVAGIVACVYCCCIRPNQMQRQRQQQQQYPQPVATVAQPMTVPAAGAVQPVMVPVTTGTAVVESK